MTLEQIKSRTQANYAINEITGALSFLDHHGQWLVRILGDQHSPSVLCMLLFDALHIAESWSPISDREAETRINRERAKSVANWYPPR